MSRLAYGFVAACLFAGCVGVDESSVDDGLNGAPEPHMFFAKDAGGRKGGSPLMTAHGGTVLTANTTYAIFWGTEWSDATFAGDKVTGLTDFFNGFGGSHYAGDSTEYAGSNGQITSASTFAGAFFDNTAAPSRALSTSAAQAEACNFINNNSLTADPSALYLIYTSTKALHVNYCAWHSWGTCNGVNIQFAYMPNLDGISGCNPGDTLTSHSPGLAALANVTAHELSETITDPRGAGWFDSSGAENGDKCAWSFPTAAEPVTFSNSVWYLQGEWSNAAYNAGTGYQNRSGQLGCLY